MNFESGTKVSVPPWHETHTQQEIWLTVNKDFATEPWERYVHLHRLVEGLQDHDHVVRAIGPTLSGYKILDSQASFETVFEFSEREKNTISRIYSLDEIDIDIEKPKLGDILFIHGYDETNPGLLKVNEWQTNYLWGLMERFGMALNHPDAEAMTLKHNFHRIEIGTNIPFIPTTQLQDEIMLREYLELYKKIVIKPYNRAQGEGVFLIDTGKSEEADEIIKGIKIYPHMIFQPYIEMTAERQLFFIGDQIIGAVEKHRAPWQEEQNFDEAVVTPDRFDRKVISNVADFTGLQIGRVDVAYALEPVKGNNKMVLELNGSGSGQIYFQGDEVIADYTEEIVKYIEDIADGVRIPKHTVPNMGR
jgi:hypothetical protein